MIDKKLITLIVILVIVMVVAVMLTFLHFKYWLEPEAMYVRTDNPKVIQVRKDLDELKAELKREGLYACCIRNDCNWCAIYMGHCPCARLVTEKGSEKSCPECAAAWNKKQGKILGVDPDAIEVTTFGVYGFEEEGRHHHEDERHH